jgi:hypothetical protein
VDFLLNDVVTLQLPVIVNRLTLTIKKDMRLSENRIANVVGRNVVSGHVYLWTVVVVVSVGRLVYLRTVVIVVSVGRHVYLRTVVVVVSVGRHIYLRTVVVVVSVGRHVYLRTVVVVGPWIDQNTHPQIMNMKQTKK